MLGPDENVPFRLRPGPQPTCAGVFHQPLHQLRLLPALSKLLGFKYLLPLPVSLPAIATVIP